MQQLSSHRGDRITTQYRKRLVDNIVLRPNDEGKIVAILADEYHNEHYRYGTYDGVKEALAALDKRFPGITIRHQYT